ncbi:MAG: mhqR [Chthonomonadales bacterium]|nr:mhqR [Chthonomonadales bacterium]
MENRPEDEATRRALRLFVVLTRCQSSVAEHARQDIQRHALSTSEFGVLELLYHKGPTTLSLLAERILITSGSLTYVVDQLVKRDLVQRVASPTDRRVTFADLTESGRTLIQTIFPDHAQKIRRTVSSLTPEEQETAITLLKKLGLSAAQK